MSMPPWTGHCGGLRHQGQICLCGSRILVQASIYERFRDAWSSALAPARRRSADARGRPGALVSQAHFDKVMACIDQARADGGRILTGGEAVHPAGRCAGGWFVAPTVIEGLAPECPTNQEEIFGPVASLIPFNDEAEALAIANGTRYGLAASVWTTNVGRAHRLAARRMPAWSGSIPGWNATCARRSAA